MTSTPLNEPIRLVHPNPLEDDSRWVILNQRFEPDWDSYEALGDMIDELMAERPADDPSRLFWQALQPFRVWRPQ